ncbi:hypothetical protein HN014_03410 [Aquimarina sp. TRL1]|uniref:C1 family peptidase n=1 Tax=Aquimarina sp. (strain TRL1) TaxID=2736252 RepID=UPI00158F4945|nr:C1 family peptidase [Aquimarina sp. TRL1]QKX03989.1 hypothetical protein HN014_03410 [Aquimarina sp. TRL1]
MRNKFTIVLFLWLLIPCIVLGQYQVAYQEVSKEIKPIKNIPCEFSWKAVHTESGMRNFTTPQREQPFQGPCLSYAFNAAIETMYMIEYNETVSLSLSDAYLDMKVFDEDMAVYKTVLESGFKVPEKIPGHYEYTLSDFFPGVDSWFDPVYNNFRTKALNCINEERNFVIAAIDEPPTTYEILDTCGEPVTDFDYLTVSDVIALPFSQVPTVDHLKNIIMTQGPVVLKVTNEETDSGYVLQKFKEYSTSEMTAVSYHAYTLIGWENQTDTTTKWLMKDSWFYGEAKIVDDEDFIELLSSGTIALYRVENIEKNNTASGVSPFVVDTALQCVPVSPLFTLWSVGVHLDYIWIGGKMYSKFFVHSNLPADEWEWEVITPAYTTSEIHGEMMSSLLVSPHENGSVTVRVKARKDDVWTPWKYKTVYLNNGVSGGMH